MTVEEEFRRLAQSIVDGYMVLPWTESTLHGFSFQIKRVALELNHLFYPREFEVTLAVNEEDHTLEASFTEKEFPLTHVTVTGFTQFNPHVFDED
jgi:hypothetical protein